MSEYQYYEFRAIDRPLTPDEMSAVGRLSSRVDLSPQHAKFIYNYSDLPARADELLAKYKVEPRTHCLCFWYYKFSLDKNRHSIIPTIFVP